MKKETNAKGKIFAYLDFNKTPLNTYISGGCPIFNLAVESDDNHGLIKNKVCNALNVSQKSFVAILRQREEAALERAAGEVIRKDTQEREAFEALLLEAERRQQFKVLDSYLDELGRSGTSTPAFRQWLNWAQERRRVFDPGQQRQEKG